MDNNLLSSFLRILAGGQFASTLVVASFVAVLPGQAPPSVLQDRADFETGNLNIFHAIVRLAADKRVPLGIIRLKSDALCRTPSTKSYKKAPVRDIFSDLLSGTGWQSVYERGVVEIRPSVVPEPTRLLLSMRFADFYAASTTVQGIGVILSGYITSRVRPGEGYAGNIIESPTAEHVSAFHLQNASVEEIMDYAASNGRKGLWIVSLSAGEGPAEVTLRDLRIDLYGYKDDAGAIKRISCGQVVQ